MQTLDDAEALLFLESHGVNHGVLLSLLCCLVTSWLLLSQAVCMIQTLNDAAALLGRNLGTDSSAVQNSCC
jgi:hypothetical protein